MSTYVSSMSGEAATTVLFKTLIGYMYLPAQDADFTCGLVLSFFKCNYAINRDLLAYFKAHS
jgi:hypothetical protein